MTRDELTEKLTEEVKARKNTALRESYWREKYFSQCVEMEKEDHKDLCKIFADAKNVPEEMADLWKQQEKILQTGSKNGFRWHPKVMRLCLELCCKNPHVLDPLRQFLTLPSNKTIRLYKNKVKERPGWSGDAIRWCFDAAKDRGMKQEDFMGDFIIDEMKIQENLEMSTVGGKHKLVGFVDLGKGHELMNILSGDEPELATQVLQFIYVSDNGFRFPIAQYSSGVCAPSSLYFCFWEGVLKMLEIGFEVYWCVLDGADWSRQFVKMHFHDKNPAKQYTGGPRMFIMDPKHNIKKIRNNIEKSSKSGKPRCLQIHGKEITWTQFKSAFNWDQKTFSLPLHEKLTMQHFDLDSASKMRNRLAEDVLDTKMLFLM
nr:uncharacterized protein LOC131768892 [Pocillopora verrucosa]